MVSNARRSLIWDGSPIHRGKEVKAYLADGAAKHIHLELLPPYAPDLNPDEGMWSHPKCVELCTS
jgi:transposase